MALAVLVAGGAGPAAGQLFPLPGGGAGAAGEAGPETPDLPPADATPEEIDRLLAAMTDAEVRRLLQLQLERRAAAAAEADAPEMRLLERVDQQAAAARERVASLARALGTLPLEFWNAAYIWQAGMGGRTITLSAGYLVVFLLAGAALEALFRRAVRDVRRRLETAPPGGVWLTLGRTGARAAFDLLGLGAFVLGAVAALLASDLRPSMQVLIASVFAALLFVRLVALVSRFLLAPRAPAMRLAPLGDGPARYGHRLVMILAAVLAVGLTLREIFVYLDVGDATVALFSQLVFLIAALIVIGAIWHRRRAVTDRLKGRADAPPSPGRRLRSQLAELWPLAATLYILTIWALGALQLTAVAVILLVLLLVPLGDALLVALIGACLPKRGGDAASGGEAEADDGGASGRPRHTYAGAARRAGQVVLLVLGVAAIAAALGVDLVALTGTGGPGARLLGAAVDIVIALLLADLAWQFVRTTVDRKLREAATAGGPGGSHGHGGEAGGEGGGVAGPGARLQTLLPILRGFVAAVLIVMVAMIVLASLGVNIGPLLAGAGVAGIAIGFGAQALVRDIVSGIFFLVDDAFRIGEYIELDNALRGTVEGISLRSLKLRHHRGAVHTVPFGEIRSMTNHSRDWVIMKLEFRVPFDTDLALVKKLVKQIGKDMQADPTLGPGLIEPLKSQGVRRWEEFNMVIGVKFTARPGEQWIIRREAYTRVRDVFEAHGIHFASREVSVRVAADASPQEVRTAAAGAAQAAGLLGQDAAQTQAQGAPGAGGG